MKFQSHKGFTLIEVLIASVILFAALAITAELYSASSLAATKATQRMRIYQLSPVALTAIKARIQDQAKNRQLTEFAGEENLLGLNFKWQAQRQRYAARARLPTDSFPPEPQFGVFKVTVAVNSKVEQVSSFDFMVATW